MRRARQIALVIAVMSLPGLAAAGAAARVKSAESSPEDFSAEVKRELTSLYQSEKAFFGEYNTYATDLKAVFFAPGGDPHFVYGFCNKFPERVGGISADYDASRNSTAHRDVVKAREYSTKYTNALGDPCASLKTLGNLDAKMTATSTTFTAFAIRKRSDGMFDVWSIDQDQHLQPYVFGLNLK